MTNYAGQDGPGRDYYANVRHEMVPFLPARYSRSLEVGCGEGVFTQLLAPGTEAWGVEMDHDSAAAAAPRMHRVLVGPYDAVQEQLPEQYFDLVVCNDVIEHLTDPEAFLQSILRRMVPGGCIIASIPNMRHWEVLWQLLVRKDWKYGREGILDRTHVRFFTEKSICRLFEEAGFTVEHQAGINGVFDPVRRLALKTIGVLTAEYYNDIAYRQFALRARRA
jgi:2-polyprenyl-3-methyl-5-hydroxy-6-metoxy-1,4-benzoquinol methylase